MTVPEKWKTMGKIFDQWDEKNQCKTIYTIKTRQNKWQKLYYKLKENNK